MVSGLGLSCGSSLWQRPPLPYSNHPAPARLETDPADLRAIIVQLGEGILHC
jgi:hypothetical protein